MIRYDKTDNEIKLCHEFSNDAEARIAEAALKDHGIECIIVNEIFSRIYPIGFNSLGGLRLLVKNADLQRARDIISSLNFS